MYKPHQKTTVMMCVLASFLGGAAVNLLMMDGNRSAIAQNAPKTKAAPKAKAAVGEFKVVKANRFMVVDTQGRPRAALTVSKKTDSPMIMFLDEEGTLRMTIALEKTGDPTIVMLSKDQKNAITLNVKKDGQGSIELVGQDGSSAGSFAIYHDAIAKKWNTRLESGAVDAKDR